MPYSFTSAAATSSCVESGLLAQSRRSAPPSRSAMARFAVSVVTCRQAVMRMSRSGFSCSNRSRMRARTGISRAAHSIRCTPWGASEWSAISLGTVMHTSGAAEFFCAVLASAWRAGQVRGKATRLSFAPERHEGPIILPPADSRAQPPDLGAESRNVPACRTRLDQLTHLPVAEPCIRSDCRRVLRVHCQDDVVAVFKQCFGDGARHCRREPPAAERGMREDVAHNRHPLLLVHHMRAGDCHQPSFV